MSKFHLTAQGIEEVREILPPSGGRGLPGCPIRRPSAEEVVDILHASGAMTSTLELGQPPITESHVRSAMESGLWEIFSSGLDAVILFERRGAIRWEIHVAAVRRFCGAQLVRFILLAMQLMRRSLGASKFIASIPASNRRAAHLAASCGYRREGVLKSSYVGECGVEDLVVFGYTEA